MRRCCATADEVVMCHSEERSDEESHFMLETGDSSLPLVVQNDTSEAIFRADIHAAIAAPRQMKNGVE